MINSELYSYKPFVKLVSFLPNSPVLIASAGKSTISPKNVEQIISEMSGEEVSKWVRELVRRSHGSPLEHSIYVFEIVCSRVCSHQFVRHRIASYTQLSQRYSDKYLRTMIVKTCGKLGFEYRESYEYYVKVLNTLLSVNLGFETLLDIVSESYIIPPSIIREKNTSFLEELVKATATYYSILAKGVSYEDARYVLPQCVKTRLLVSMNARELVEVFLPLRMCSRAQWEIRYIAWNMWRQLVSIHPEIFKYTGPRCVNIDTRVNNKLCTLEEYINGVCEFKIERCPELVSRENIIDCLKNSNLDPWSGIYLLN